MIKRQYAYEVAGIPVDTREIARETQRDLRAKGFSKNSTKILQKVTTSVARYVR